MESTNEYISIDGFKSFLKLLYAYLLKKKILIATGIVICAGLGLTASFLYKPRYNGKLTFVLQNAEDAGGGLSGLAGQFGLSLGGGSGTFSGDNIFELLFSRTLVEKALLAPVQTPEGKNTLLNEYIKTYKLDQQWAESEEEDIRNLSFPPGQHRESFTRLQDSIMGDIYTSFISKALKVYKVDKKLSIGCIEMQSKSEFFSKNFVEKLIEETSSYYINTKTKLSRQNYNVLKNQADSIKELYDQLTLEYAQLADRKIGTIRQSANVDLVRMQTEIQMLSTSYIEMIKNLELMKMTISKQTPLVEVIDRPIMPLEVQKIGKIIGTFVGGFLGAMFSFGFFTFIFIWKNRKSLL